MSMIYPIYNSSYDNVQLYPNWYNTMDICWSSKSEQIKSYFRREVLSLIEKGERLCGVDPSGPCPNCYAYKEICHFHEEIVYVSFDELKKHKNDTILIINPLLSYYDYSKISGEMYMKIYTNWRDRINTFSYNQSK